MENPNNKMTLKRPVTNSAGVIVSEVVYDIPTVGDILAAKRRAQNPFEEDMHTIASMIKWTPEDMVKLAFPDFIKLQKILEGMIDSPLGETTQTSTAK